jgi:hypothetical protein
MPLLLSLRQRKLMSALGTLGHFTLYRGRTSRTGKSSAIRYVEGEATFRTIHYVFRLRTQSGSLSLGQQLGEILKTFLEMLNHSAAEILTTLKTIKYYDSKYMKTCLLRRTGLGMEC